MSEEVIEFIPNNYVSKGQISIKGTVYHNIPYEVTDEFSRIVEENKQLKEVIEEVKKYIQENLFEGNNGCGCYWQQFDDYTDAKSELLKILDKVQGDK